MKKKETKTVRWSVFVAVFKSYGNWARFSLITEGWQCSFGCWWRGKFIQNNKAFYSPVITNNMHRWRSVSYENQDLVCRMYQYWLAFHLYTEWISTFIARHTYKWYRRSIELKIIVTLVPRLCLPTSSSIRPNFEQMFKFDSLWKLCNVKRVAHRNVLTWLNCFVDVGKHCPKPSH